MDHNRTPILLPKHRPSYKPGHEPDHEPEYELEQPLSQRQVNFLWRVVAAVPRLFSALEEGNVKSELILGLRRVNSKQARLKLVAELVDPGANPLETHGSREPESTNGADGAQENTQK